MFIPLKDRVEKLPYKRAQRCKFLAYSYTTILVPTYIVLFVNDNGTYGVFLYPSFGTMASTALLKFLPEDGNP